MQEIQTEILVVGGGPTGMAAAIEAASHGHDVLLVAPKAGPESDERTTALMLPAIDLLREAGVWDALKDAATPLRTMRIIDGSHRLVRAPTVSFEANEIDEDVFGYNIPNRALNAALAEAVDGTPGIKRREGMASAATFSDGHATVTLMDGQLITARLVVAADGARSILRETAGIGSRRWSYPQSAVVLSFAHSRPHNNVSTEFHTESGPFTQVPMAGNQSSLVWVVTPQEAERITSTDPSALATEIETRMDSVLGQVSKVTKPQAWPLTGMIAHRFAATRIVLVGQAAHVFPPIGAQGLNLGLRDIADLGKCLPSAGMDPGAAAVTGRYNRLRVADVASRTGAVHLLNRSLLTGFLPIQLARAAGLGLLGAVKPLRGVMMREGVRPGSGLASLFRLPRLRERDRRAEDRWS